MLTTMHKISGSNTLARTRRVQGKNFYFISLCMRYFTVSKALGTIAIVVVMAFIMTSIKAIDALLDVPIESVSIEGDSEFSSRELIQDIINASSVDGFVGLDLSSLHDKLQSLPWIRYVSIKRKIPNKLVVYIEEEMVIARWSDQGYLTEHGDVVISKGLDNLVSLPHLSGDNPRLALRLLEKSNRFLHEELKPIKAISLSDIGAVKLRLADDIELVVDSENFDKQMKRWETIYATSLSQRIKDIKRVDLRYSNGLAVAFKQELQKNNKLYVGGRD